MSNAPPNVPPNTPLPDRPPATAWWWQLALAALVAPFYIGLYVITAVGAAFGPRR